MKRIKIIDIDTLKPAWQEVAAAVYNHEIIIVRSYLYVDEGYYGCIYDRYTLEPLYIVWGPNYGQHEEGAKVAVASLMALSAHRVDGCSIKMPEGVHELTIGHAEEIGLLMKDSGMDVLDNTSWESVILRWRKNHERAFGSRGSVE